MDGGAVGREVLGERQVHGLGVVVKEDLDHRDTNRAAIEARQVQECDSVPCMCSRVPLLPRVLQRDYFGSDKVLFVVVYVGATSLRPGLWSTKPRMGRVLAIPGERRSHALHEYSLVEIWELPEVYANQ